MTTKKDEPDYTTPLAVTPDQIKAVAKMFKPTNEELYLFRTPLNSVIMVSDDKYSEGANNTLLDANGNEMGL